MKTVIAVLLIACVISVIQSQVNPDESKEGTDKSSEALEDLGLSGPGAAMIAKREACNRDDDEDDDERRRK
ncbi:CLUMA_CG010251, isoform A [Clunio marinus]|uniref:CLUMA_CG010251, isoform A n=1 Tax=Clunio marinus TaxID=568069 RepID=A0A1J1I8M0_9DIPT|nr:CLUMA_CG010251, isoform A [Clunio marinus]